MSTPQPLHSAPDSPQHHGAVQVSPTPPNLPLNLPLQFNILNAGVREPPHFSSLIGKSVSLDKKLIEIVEVIAEGGFGVIFLAKGVDKVKYALKRVVVNNLKDYEGVLGEIAVMSLISPKTAHLLPSITHSISTYQGSTFEIQNLMPLASKNLLQIASQRVQKSQYFESTEILQILHHVATGLQYLHSSSPPIIHRDIKIENILLLDDNYVLSDFGSATTKAWDPSVDNINSIVEDLDKNTTLQYRSPEMVDLYGGRGAITCGSDVWALGVCAFKLMSFKDPFESILAIQNRNLNWSSTKSRYPEHLVLFVECLLAEHQTTRPSVEEVIKISTSALCSDWGPVNLAFAKILEDKKTREEASVKRTTQSANVVMETTVTPRQRPKRGLQGGTVVQASVVPVLAPPKSPCRPVSPGGLDNSPGKQFFSPPAPPTPPQLSPTAQNPTPSPTNPTVSQVPQSVKSYNPFDDSWSCDNEPTEANNTNDEETDDSVFLNAPFDYFKYQPIMMTQGAEESQEQFYAPNNPFLYPDQDYTLDLSNNNGVGGLATGVCNLSFDEGAANQVNSSNQS